MLARARICSVGNRRAELNRTITRLTIYIRFALNWCCCAAVEKASATVTIAQCFQNIEPILPYLHSNFNAAKCKQIRRMWRSKCFFFLSIYCIFDLSECRHPPSQLRFILLILVGFPLAILFGNSFCTCRTLSHDRKMNENSLVMRAFESTATLKTMDQRKYAAMVATKLNVNDWFDYIHLAMKRMQTIPTMTTAASI